MKAWKVIHASLTTLSQCTPLFRGGVTFHAIYIWFWVHFYWNGTLMSLRIYGPTFSLCMAIVKRLSTLSTLWYRFYRAESWRFSHKPPRNRLETIINIWQEREVLNIRSGDTKAGQSTTMQHARKCKHEGKGEISTVCIMLMASSEARLKRSGLAKSVVFRISARIWCDMLISQGEPANGHH